MGGRCRSCSARIRKGPDFSGPLRCLKAPVHQPCASNIHLLLNGILDAADAIPVGIEAMGIAADDSDGGEAKFFDVAAVQVGRK